MTEKNRYPLLELFDLRGQQRISLGNNWQDVCPLSELLHEHDINVPQSKFDNQEMKKSEQSEVKLKLKTRAYACPVGGMK